MTAGQTQSRGAGVEKDRTLRTSAGAARRSGSIAPAVAKKVRTPPPPRRVQAPQRRDSKKRDERRAALNRDYFAMKWVLIGAVVAIAAIVVVLFVVLRDETPGSNSASPTVNYNALPGIRKTKAPWPPEYATLTDRLQPLGLNALAQEQLAFHIHQHVDIFVDGKPLPGGVPAGIGINDDSYITELHTHATSGVIHVESARKLDFTLGQFFAEWAVFLNKRCVGAYCNGLKWYVDGVRQVGNPQKLVLKNHQEIVIVVGKPPKKIPATFDWAAWNGA
jgi:hypothetical protein